MLPLVLIALGVGAMVAGSIGFQRIAPRVRVGRIVAATPLVTIAEARALAASGKPRYVGVRGRIDAEEDFEDFAHRPLVLRRTRVEARRHGGWRSFEDSRELVPFEIRDGLDAIRVDGRGLDSGLVVVPRESEGVASDLGERAPADVAPDTPVRVIVEQVSAVDRAVVLGVPVMDGTDGPVLTAGLGRPLVLTTLERPEAIRLLGGGRRASTLAAGVLLALGTGLIVGGVVVVLLDLLT